MYTETSASSQHFLFSFFFFYATHGELRWLAARGRPCCLHRSNSVVGSTCRKQSALRPQKRGCCLGTGTGGGRVGGGRRESEGFTARSDPEDVATSVLRSCSFNCSAEQSHKDNVRCTAIA